MRDRERESKLERRHLLVGWSLILVFAGLGAVLEIFHGLKVGWYLDLGNATRRMMWTLAHAHGVLLGLVNLAFAVTLKLWGMRAEMVGIVSATLIGASVLLPGGFLLGGLVVYGGDPGLGILLTPAGAALLLLAMYWIVRGVGRGDPVPSADAAGSPRRGKRAH